MTEQFRMKITGVQIVPIIKSIVVEGDVLEGSCARGDIVCIHSEEQTVRAKVKAVSAKGGKPSADTVLVEGRHGALALEDIKGEKRFSEVFSFSNSELFGEMV